MVVVALMTQAGFAGNLRYVALPAALVCVLAGAGWVGVIRAARRALRAHRRDRARRRARARRAPVRDLPTSARLRDNVSEHPLGGRPLRRAPGGDRQGRRRAKPSSAAERSTRAPSRRRRSPGTCTCTRPGRRSSPMPPGTSIAPRYSALVARPALPAGRRDPQVGRAADLLRLARLYPAADGDLRLTPGVGAAGPRRSRARGSSCPSASRCSSGGASGCARAS